MGVKGTAIATIITYFLNFVLSVLYVIYLKKVNRPIRESWHFINKDSFVNLFSYFKQAINCCLLLILEWWCFELL